MHWTVLYLKQRLAPYRVYAPAALVALAALVAGVAADLVVSVAAPLHWRAERAARSGELEVAERLYWTLLARVPVELPVLLDFLEVREALFFGAELVPRGEGLIPGRFEPTVSDAEIRALLGRSDLGDGVGLAGSYWWAVLRERTTEEERAEVAAAAATEPPTPWANHVLGFERLGRGELVAAARHLEREGLRPGGPVEDLSRALELLHASGNTVEVEARVADPRWRAAVTPGLRSDLAFARHRWGEWLAWLWPASYLRGSVASWLLAALAAALWGWFCWRLGGEPRRLAAAFLLGALSIYPTHVLIHLEEVIPALRQSGDLLGDAVYFVLGVGLREEAAKLLCFLPLLLLLRRGKARGEGLVLGAVVGLGFAAVENVGYFDGGSLATTLTRFLTANFLHISLTAVSAEAVTEAVRAGSDGSAARAVNTFGLVVVLHGAYDWFLSTPLLGELSFLAMTTFVVSSQQFLRAAPVGRSRGGMPLVRVVLLALVILAGASFVYGSAVAGPAAAAISLGQGLLGVVVILVMFHRELGPAR